MDCDWRYIGNSNSRYKSFDILPKKPKCLEKMISASRVLSKPFPFVRIDFYEIDGKLIFGEMTFFPNSCIGVSEININGRSMGEVLIL